jgi:hypothetical protein
MCVTVVCAAPPAVMLCLCHSCVAMQFGEEPHRVAPHAGLTNKSMLRQWDGGIGGPEPGASPANPHAGKGQVSQLTISSGTLTVMPNLVRREALGVRLQGSLG